jgi:hypothetical protein
MEPDTKASKTTEDRRRIPAEASRARADAVQVKLFAQALVSLGLTEYSARVSDTNRPV